MSGPMPRDRLPLGVSRASLVSAAAVALLLLILAEFGRVVLRLVGLDAPLGWDEAVYANRARAWLDADLPASGWSSIRPPLLPLVSTLPVLIGGEEWQLRLTGLLAGTGLLLAAWWTARSVAGTMAGTGVAAILMTSPTLQQQSALALTDVPAAALLVLLTGLLWHQLELRERPGWGLVLAAAVAGLAFLTRYGSVVVLAPMLAAAAVIWWPRLASAPRVTLAALGLGGAFLAGHLAGSWALTGSPIGIIAEAQEIVAVYDGEQPRERYREFLLFQHAGSVGHLAMYAGFLAVPVAAFAAVHSPAWARPLRGAVLLVTPALGQVVLLTRGVGHVEPRFFIASTAMFVIAGLSVAALLLRRLPPAYRFGIAVAFLAAIVAYRGASVERSHAATLGSAAYHEQFRIAGASVGELAGDRCGVVARGYTMVAWYARCEGQPLRVPDDGGPVATLLDAPERWVVVPGSADEPRLGEPLARLALEGVEGEPHTIRDPRTGEPMATAWRYSSSVGR